MKARRYKRRIQEEPQINLTPLIDVVFVILIMFIVVVPLLEAESIKLAQGTKEQLQPLASNQPTLTLHVFANNTIHLNGQSVEINKLSLLLARAKQENPHLRLILLQDQAATFGLYQSVKNAATRSGFEEMDLVLKSEP